MDSNSHAKIDLRMVKLIFEYMRAGHPFAASISRESTLALVKSLSLRLRVNEEDLDFSSRSIKLVENLLIKYHTNNTIGITDDESMLLIRELSAYIGEVLTRHTDGRWVILNNTIWGTQIDYEGKWTLLKEGKRQYVAKVSYTLADIAATSWQNVLNEKPLQLYKCIKNIQRKLLKEELTS